MLRTIRYQQSVFTKWMKDTLWSEGGNALIPEHRQGKSWWINTWELSTNLRIEKSIAIFKTPKPKDFQSKCSMKFVNTYSLLPRFRGPERDGMPPWPRGGADSGSKASTVWVQGTHDLWANTRCIVSVSRFAYPPSNHLAISPAKTTTKKMKLLQLTNIRYVS